MVAVFSGNGLGLFDTSLMRLGTGLGGSAGLGQGRDSQRVNAANGNLVLQTLDESLLVRGLNASYLRTYNSRGSVAGAGQDGWTTGFERNVVLTGLLTESTSSVAINTGDGQTQVFAWVAANTYRSTAGDGAHDTAVWNGSTWTVTEGSSRREETYADHASATLKGRLIAIREFKSDGTTPAQFDVVYDAQNRVSEVRSVDGAAIAARDAILFTYNASGQLESVGTRENGVLKGQVSYGYDAVGRLAWVQTDLTPTVATDNTWNAATPAANDGLRFRTNYTYVTTAASDLRIASLVTGDGVRVAYTYEADGSGGFRVKTVTQGSAADGSQRITTFTYGANSTDVVDGAGRTWTYEYDADRQLVAVLEPAVAGLRQKTSYTYDAAGNVVRISQAASAGAAALLDTVFTYDGNGNRTLQRDRLGNTVAWTYSANNELLAETHYATPDADGLDPTHAGTTNLPTGASTTRFAYDGRGRLRFAISALGEVREYTYATSGNGIGQLATERRYLGHTYVGATHTEADLIAWATTARKASSALTAYAYDAKGRLQQQAQYAAVDGNGAGLFDAATAVTNFSYDAQGLLRQKVVVQGSGRSLAGDAPAGSQVTDYVYDGLGRLVAALARDAATAAMPDPVTDAAAHATWLAANDAATVLTSYDIDDSAGRIRIVQDAGSTRTELRNQAGELLSSAESGVVAGVTVTRTTQLFYDASGRLRASQDAAGARSYFFYDGAGRVVASVDGTGAVTETRYDGIGREVRTVAYARTVDTTGWLSGTTVVKNSLVFAASAPALNADQAWVQTVAADDRHTQRSYDAAGRLATITDPLGLVSTHAYDGNGRLLATTLAKPGDATVVPRVTRFLYDAVDRLVGTLDAGGFLTESVYDIGGRVVKTIRYANASPAAQLATGTLAQLRPTVHADDQVTRFFHDGRGRQIGALDAEGYLVEQVLDDAGNQRATRAYGKKLAALTGSETLAALRTLATTNLPANTILVRETRRSFDAFARTSTEVDHEGTVTRYRYDEAGRLVGTERGNVASEIRQGTHRYDVFGNLVGELGGEGSTRVLAGMTEAQLDAVYAQYGTRHSYDLVGRRIESIDAAGNKTWYFHDAQGRQTFAVRGVASTAGVANSLGEVSETRYSAFGEVTDTIAYTARITIVTPGSRASVQTAVAALAVNATADSRVQLRYDQRGQLREQIDARGFRTMREYTAFAELWRQTSFEADGTTVFATRTQTWDARGLLGAVVENGGGLSRTQGLQYDAFGRLVRRTDARGAVVTLAYDRLGRQVAQTALAVSGRDEAIGIDYDAFGQVVARRDALGQATTFRYDDVARSVTVTTPEGVAITTANDRFGSVATVTQRLPDGSDAVTRTEYDKDGRVLRTIDALGNVAARAHDARGVLVRTTDASGRVVDYVHDAAGRVITRVEDAGGLNLTTRYEYDAQGRQVSVVDASGRRVTMAYDRGGNLVETIRDPGGLALKTTYAWDRDGRQLQVVEGVGTAAARTTTYEYDKLGRRIRETQGAGVLNLVTSYAYDAGDNVVRRTDASGRSVRHAYDAAERLRFSIDDAGGVVERAYDAAGRETMVLAYAKAATAAGLPALPSEAEMAAAVVSQALANAARDEVEYRIHDRDGRVAMTVDGTGAVAVSGYDAAGRRVLERAHAQPVALTATLRNQLRAGTATAASVAVVAAASDQSLRTVYDAAGRVVYAMNAAGGIVRKWYDAAGRVAAQVRFATPLNPAAVGDATTVAQLDALLVWSAADQTEYYVHDAAGRLRYTYNGLGQLTQQGYDGAGRPNLQRTYATALWVTPAVQGKLFAGTAVEADFSAFATANEGSARAQYMVYDAAGRARYTVTRSAAGVGIVGETVYDAASRVVAQVQYGATVAFNPAHTDATLTTAVAALAKRTTGYVHDAAGRLRFTLDASGAASELRYDGAGRITDTIAYGQRPPAGTATEAALVAWAQAQPVGQVRRTQTAYDAGGRLQVRTDAAGFAETFGYDGLGRELTHVDRNGKTWTSEYDAAGRRTAEISPQVSVTSISAAGVVSAVTRAVVARYTYDALGNLLTRTDDADAPLPADRRVTSYAYDSRGNQVRTTFADAGAVDPATGAIAATGVQATIEVTYNTLGQAVVHKDVLGFRSYRVYDSLGRIKYEIDQKAHVTSYDYNGFGEQTLLRRHAQAFDPAVLAGWTPGQELTLARVQTAGAVTSSGSDRTLATSFDALGRRTALVASAVDYYRADGSVGNGSPTTALVYNAYGEVVQEGVLREGTAGQAGAQWSYTHRYYDTMGRNTLTVDAEGYVTRTQFNATGEATETTEYGRALAQPPVLNVVPGLPVPGDAATGFDRQVSWTYDAMGRKQSETAVRHYQRVDGSSGVRDVVRSFGYDGEGNATTVSDDTGVTTTVYDALGRAVSVQEPGRAVVVAGVDGVLTGSTARDLTSTQVYEQRSPYTTVAYDAFGNAVQVRRYANGRNGAAAAVADDARDQVQLVRHDRLGRAVWERDAAGTVTTRRFDAADHVLEVRYALDGNEGRTNVVRILSTYDATGRLLGNSTLRDRYQDGAFVATATDAGETVVYNAFGEITAKTHAGVAGALAYGYDAAGRMTSSNESGAVRSFGYNLAGHQVRESHAAFLGSTEGSVQAVTTTVVDRLGRGVEVRLPAHTEAAATTGTLTQRFDRWGNVLQVIDARGYQTDYEYNDFDQVVRETRPLVLVVAENGGESWQRPVNYVYYDALGRLIATRDANGNLRSNEYDAAGRLVATRDSAGNVTRHAYDALGNQRLDQNPLGYLTFKDYDRLGRNTAIGDFQPTADGLRRDRIAQQAYTLNQAGARLSVATALGDRVLYDYDSRQQLLRSRTQMGVIAEYGYDAMGRRIREASSVLGTPLTDRDGESVRTGEQSWDYDVFGRVTDSNNLSGRDGNYVYDPASGQLVSESFAGGSGIAAGTGTKTYSYYANGRIRQIVETGGGTYRYEYDAAGNRTVEETTATDTYGQYVRTLTRTTYDSNNRIQRVVQDDLTSGKRVFDLITDYDANGNRRRVRAASGYGPNVEGIVVANTAPVVVKQVDDVVVRKGVNAQFRLLFTDIFRDLEQDALSLTIDQAGGAALPAWLVVTRDADTGELVFAAAPGAGLADQDITVRLTAFETATPANTVSETFVVRVRANSVPVTIDPAVTPLRIKTNKPWSMDLVVADWFRDVDVGDDLTLSIVTSLPSWLLADTSTPGVIRLSGTPTAASTFTLRLRATDEQNAYAEKTFAVTTAANAVPTVVTPAGATDAIVGRQFAWTRTLPALFRDLDADPLQVSAKLADGSALPAWMAFQYLHDQAVPEIRFTGNVPANEVDGRVYSVVLTARDPDGGVVTTTLTVRVYNNRAPVPTAGTTALPALRVYDNYSQTLPLTAFFNDPENDALAIVPVWPAGSTLPAWLHVTVDYAAGTLTFSGRPTSNAQAGTYGFELRATDDAGLTSLKAFSITIGADNAPVRSTVALADRTLSIGRGFSYQLPAGLFTDPDGDPVTLQASKAVQMHESEPGFEWWYVDLQALPAWMSFDAATRTFSGTVPTGQSAGSFAVRVHGIDSRGRANDADENYVGGAGYGNDGDIIFNLQAWVNSPPSNPLPPPARTIVHGGAVDFVLPAGSFVEPDGDALTYSGQVQVGASWVDIAQIGLAVNAATGRITGTATNLTQATFNARIVARDPQGLIANGAFVFTVTNTPPTVTTIPAQSAGRNAAFSLSLATFFADVNANPLTYSASGLPAGLSLNTATGVISGAATAAIAAYPVTVSASDGRGGSATTSFTLSVVNSAPVAPAIPNQTATAGTAWSYVVPAFTDPNGDMLTYTATGLPSWVAFDAATRTLSGTAGAIGTWTITIRATDPSTAFATRSFTLTTPSTPPVYNGGLANQTAPPAQAFSYTFAANTFTDPNGDALTYTADANGVALPAWLSFDAANRRFSGTPVAAGTITVRVTATDGTTPVARTFTITVPNVGPVAGTPLPNRTAPVSTAVSWTLPGGAFSDPNGDAIGYTLLVERPPYITIDNSNPYEPEVIEHPAAWIAASAAGLSIAANGTITGTLYGLYTDEVVYDYRAKVVATSTGGTAEAIFAISANVAPTAPAIPNLTAKQNLAWTYTVPAFSDGNGNALSYVIAGLPSGLSFNPSTRVISGTPTQAGAFTVTVTASDGLAATPKAFTLTVQANTAPTPPAVSNLTGTINTAFNAALPVFTDADFDALTYQVTGLPPGLAFNAATRTITGTPTTAGTWTASYRADDGRGGIVSVGFTVTIGNTPPANRAPVVADGLEDQWAVSGQYFQYQFATTAFSDPDGNPLTYTATRSDGSALPAWLQFDAANRRFYGTPAGPGSQVFTIRVVARDPSGLTVYDDFLLEKEGGGGGGIPKNQPLAQPQGGVYAFAMGSGAASGGTATVMLAPPDDYEPPPRGGGTPVPVQVKDQWFTYDGENRIQINGGALSGVAGAAGTTIVIGSSAPESYSLMYDAAGNVVVRLVRYGSNDVAFRTAYDLRGRKVLEFHGEGVGGAAGGEGGIAKQYTYDNADRLVETRSFYDDGTTVPAREDGEGMPMGPDMSVAGWLSGAEQFVYDGDGRLVSQVTLTRTGGLGGIRWRDGTQDDLTQRTSLTVLAADSRVDYTAANGASGYDALGRVSVYRYSSKSIQWATHTYTSAYEGWSSWQEKTVTGNSSNTNYRATTNTLTYDAYGRLTKQVDKTPLPSNYGVLQDRARAYTYTGDGKVLTRREGTLENNVFTQVNEADGSKGNYLFVHAGGQQQAELKEGGRIRTGSGNTYYSPQIQALNGRGNYAAGGGTVTVQQGENLQSLAQRVYGNASLWYVLADANGLSDPEGELVAGTQLSTPKVTVNSNDAATFKPYDPAEAIGSTTPSLPYITPPPKQSCNALAMIIIIIVVIVVTVYTAGAAASAFGATGTVTGGTAAAGATAGTVGAAATGTAITGAVSTGVVASTGIGAIGGAVLGGGAIAGSIGAAGIAGAAFIGGVAGSIAGQVVGKALGVRDSFSLREAFAGGLSSLAGAGIAGALGAGSVTARFAIVGEPGKAAASAVLNGLSSYAANRIAGLDVSFSWKSIAASAVAAAVTSAAAPKINGVLGIRSDFGRDLGTNLVGGVATLHARRAFGFDDPVDYGRIVADAFGNALANAAVRTLQRGEEMRAQARAAMACAAEDAEALEFIRSMDETADGYAEGVLDGEAGVQPEIVPVGWFGDDAPVTDADLRRARGLFEVNGATISVFAERLRSEDSVWDLFVTDLLTKQGDSPYIALIDDPGMNAMPRERIDRAYFDRNREFFANRVAYKGQFSLALADRVSTLLDGQARTSGVAGIDRITSSFSREDIALIANGDTASASFFDSGLLRSLTGERTTNQYYRVLVGANLAGLGSVFELNKALVNHLPATHPYTMSANSTLATIVTVSSGLPAMDDLLGELRTAIAENAGGLENPLVRTALEKTILAGIKLTHTAVDKLRLGRIPHFGRILENDLTIGAIGETVTMAVLKGSGLFATVTDGLKNGSDNGIDIVGIDHAGKSTVFEVKTSAQRGRRWLELKGDQDKGANAFAQDRAGKAFRKWGLTPADRAVARQIMTSGPDNGYVVQISQYGLPKPQVQIYDWVPNLNVKMNRKGR